MTDVYRMTSIDLNAPEVVEVRMDHTGTKVWVNVNDKCLFRAQDIKNLVVNDDREDKKSL